MQGYDSILLFPPPCWRESHLSFATPAFLRLRILHKALGVYLVSIPRDFPSGKVKVLCVVDVLNGVSIFRSSSACCSSDRLSRSAYSFSSLDALLGITVRKAQCAAIDFIGNFRNAYKIAEYRGLDPTEEMQSDFGETIFKNVKEKIDLPAGCKVEFDDRVIDVFWISDFESGLRHAIQYRQDTNISVR